MSGLSARAIATVAYRRPRTVWSAKTVFRVMARSRAAAGSDDAAREVTQWPQCLSYRLAHPQSRGISLGLRLLFLNTMWAAAYLASRFFLITCKPRPPCFKQVGTPFKAMLRQRSPVHFAVASHRRLLVRPRLNADCTREARHAALPDPDVRGIFPPRRGSQTNLTRY
jgi:hypothetical protein